MPNMILPEGVSKVHVDAAVALAPVCAVHSNPEATIVPPACCKSADGKNLTESQTNRGCALILRITNT